VCGSGVATPDHPAPRAALLREATAFAGRLEAPTSAGPFFYSVAVYLSFSCYLLEQLE